MRKSMLFAFLLSITIYSNAQDIKRTIIRGSSQTDLQLKDKQLIINNQTFDFRVLRYYNETDLNTMDATKRSQILYLYTQSYNIIEKDACASLTDIDYNKIEHLRDNNISKIINYGNDCKIKIELLSKNTVQQQLTFITGN